MTGQISFENLKNLRKDVFVEDEMVKNLVKEFPESGFLNGFENLSKATEPKPKTVLETTITKTTKLSSDAGFHESDNSRQELPDSGEFLRIQQQMQMQQQMLENYQKLQNDIMIQQQQQQFGQMGGQMQFGYQIPGGNGLFGFQPQMNQVQQPQYMNYRLNGML